MSLPNAQVLMGLSRIFEIFDKNTSRCPSSGGWSLIAGKKYHSSWRVSLGKMVCLIRIRRINNLSNLGCFSNNFESFSHHKKHKTEWNWSLLLLWSHTISSSVANFHHCRVCSCSKIWGTSSGFRTWCCRPLRSWRSRQGHLGSVVKVY